MTVKIFGKNVLIKEPVFGTLRKVISEYNNLSTDISDTDKVMAVEAMLFLLIGNIKIHKLSSDELTEFLKAVPDICGLTTSTSNSKASTKDHWGDIYAHLSMCLGWTYDYINEHMTLSRLAEYQGYWDNNPPTHQLVAAYMGFEAKDKSDGNAFLAAIVEKAKMSGAING